MKYSRTGSRPRNIRLKNRKVILDLYRIHGPVSNSFIAKKVGLSRTSVMKINEDLLKEGLICDAGKGLSTDEGGKKPTLYQLNAARQKILSFHVMYNRILFRISDLACLSIAEDEVPIERDSGLDIIVGVIRKILERNHLTSAESADSILACMVAVHGDMDSSRGVCIHSTYFPSWGTNTDIRRKIEADLNLNCTVYVDSWIRMKAYGENKIGLARSHESVVLIDAGWHGVTASLLLNGEIYHGRNFLAGEIGHICLDRNSPVQCACGSSGCFEALVSCKNLIEEVREKRAAADESGNLQNDITLESIFRDADSGETTAMESLDSIILWFSQAISGIVTFFDPEIILIEGDYSSGCIYLENGISAGIGHLSLPRLSRHTPLVFNSRDSVDTLKGSAILAVDMFLDN